MGKEDKSPEERLENAKMEFRKLKKENNNLKKENNNLKSRIGLLTLVLSVSDKDVEEISQQLDEEYKLISSKEKS